jgi:hypothetical protein
VKGPPGFAGAGRIRFKGGAGSPRQRADIQRRAGFDLGPPTDIRQQRDDDVSITIGTIDSKSRRTPLSEPAIDRTTLPRAPIDVLALRAEARALLWVEPEIETIPEVVDPLHAFAVKSGLVAEIGQDAVQKILSDSFAPYRKSEDDSEIKQQPRLSLGALWEKLNDLRRRPTTESTIEAILWTFRQRGLAALKEPATKERLSCCDQAARAQINKRIEASLKKETTS